MSLLKFFPDLPAWSAFVLTLFWVLGAFELGYRLGAVRHRTAADEKPGPVGQLGVATLGMLGFFLAFAFGLAANRYEGKRQLVIDEANAIGTMVSIGYHAALSETRRSPAIVPLALTLAVVMWLIAELDRGHEGLLMVSQQPLVEALRGMGGPAGP